MKETKAIAIVGMGAILPDAPDVTAFWQNIQNKKYSIRDVPADRWRPDLYFDPDHSAPDKTYTKIGGWVDQFPFEPYKWGIAIPPRVLAVMDIAQQWAIATAHQALVDYGYPQRPLNPERVAVILGNALAGENHYQTAIRIHLPEMVEALTQSSAYQGLPEEMKEALVGQFRESFLSKFSTITEDTMPGELANIIAGRVANVFNFTGPNYVTDAACASSLAALENAVEGLANHHFDAVITGGVDRSMGVQSFVKFCKIGALSADGSRPYSDGANGFVMGEGAAVFLLKRLEDAERDGDRIYAVIRGVGGSSDGKGKGITAPNPLGQQRAIERAWQDAGLSPATVGLIEGHGTSTRVGDVAEVTSLNAVFGSQGLPAGRIALGSVKSNIGHLKSAAGAAGLMKAALALHHRVLPPTANFQRPNPNIDFAHMPFYVNTGLTPWEVNPGEARRAGVSSFGFGGANFHVVLEEYRPGILAGEGQQYSGVNVTAAQTPAAPAPTVTSVQAQPQSPAPYRGMLVLGAPTTAELKTALEAALANARQGTLPERRMPERTVVEQPERLVVDYDTAEELVKRLEKALNAFESDAPATWKALSAQNVYRGSGKPGKVAFLFPGQGSQYVNMLRDLADIEPLVTETFREADAVMTPILGRPLTSYIFVEGDEASIKQAENDLRDTRITQPAVLTVNVALLQLMKRYGFQPDLVIGHSLGEYAALVAAGVLTFAEALEVVSARGREMSKIKVADNGCMAAVSAPIAEVERILKSIDGYVVVANINSPLQCVIGGETPAVEAAIAAFQAAGMQAVKIAVSHAFHTRIVAPASEPLRRVIAQKNVLSPKLTIVANVTGKLYPTTREEILDILAQQVASPVQFIRGVETLYENGARVLVEIGPKRVLNALASDILKEKSDIAILATNHPRKGGLASFSEALCGLIAAGVVPFASDENQPEKAMAVPAAETASQPTPQASTDGRLPLTGSVVISGAGLGLPGRDRHVFADDNVARILRGEMCIETIPSTTRTKMLDKHITRLVKSDAGAVMVEIDDLEQTVKLAGQSGLFNPQEEFGIPADRLEATDITTQLAMAAGIEALRDAGVPLVMTYRQTSKGTSLPDRWKLPEALADETGVIFASAFPGMERMAEESRRYYTYQALLDQVNALRELLAQLPTGPSEIRAALEGRIAGLVEQIQSADYHFDRRFIFRVLAMGHSQFAEHIGARGPNTSVNAACASTTHAVALAEDWIRMGRCRRVIVIAGDDVTDGDLMDWIGSGFLASGAMTTEGDVRKAALPFDRRRNGLIMGMGAAALVVEAEDALRERGMSGICEVLSSVIANSAFHGTRLDVQHVCDVMDRLVAQAERRFHLRRAEIARQMVFVSHETYTPARGGSAAAEIHALRQTFGDQANQVVIANTKGFTGHAMAVGIEDVVAVKALEYSLVPPIAHLDGNFEPDPDLGDLNLSRGGKYPIRYALRLGAGFGSQIAMTLVRQCAGVKERVNAPAYQRWLAEVSGYEQVETEVVQRTLRIKQAGVPTRQPRRSAWQDGQGPTLWAKAAEDAPVASPTETALPATVPAQPAAATPKPDHEEIKAYVLSAVSEKTGYPAEMLDLDLDLEADLGIDTVKQAELFATVRTHYGIPRREDLRLSDYNTLSKVIGFIETSLAAGIPAPQTASQTAEQPAVPAPVQVAPVSQAAPAPAPQAEAPVAETDKASIQSYVLTAVSEKTGYPTEMLDLDLDLEADLGIDTVKQAELFATVRTHYNIPRREDLRLSDYNTLAKVIGFVQAALASGASAPALTVAAVTEPAAPVAHAEPAPAVAVAAAETADEDVKAYVLSVVSEKTGYPTEMLDLDLDLEADLGIDTVKQAELFATVRTHYGISRREDLRLSDYNTLTKVIGFVHDARQAVVETPAVSPAFAAIETAVEPAGDVQPIQPRIPVPTLRPRLDLCLPTGIELNAESRVLVVGDRGKTGEALVKRLRGLKALVLAVKAEAGEEALASIAKWQAAGPIQGIYFLPALDVEPALQDMTAEVWQAELEKRLYLLYRIARLVEGKPFVVCATRLGGLHGYGKAGATAPLGGAVSGFTKALAKERPESLVKVVDFDSSISSGKIANRLIQETLHDPAVTEIGWDGDLRFSLTLTGQALPAMETVSLEDGSVFVVSGGTAGIMPSILLDLARSAKAKFYLLARSPLPASDDPDLARLNTDRNALRLDLLQRPAADGKKVTPAMVEQKLASLDRAAATLQVMEQVQKLGSQAVYLPCDVADAASVQAAIAKISQAEPRIDVLIHAAGLDHSRRLEVKPESEFRQVVGVKADGFFHLFKALEQAQRLPRKMVFFSSVAGRFGNSGQTDYSAANDLLCKIASAVRAQYPEIEAIALDWGAWAEVGMASRGGIPDLMKLAGVELMKPESAAPLVRLALSGAFTQTEVIVAGAMGAMQSASENGGLDTAKANAALRQGKPAHTMLSEVTGMDAENHVILQVELDPQQQPFLKDHSLNGVPVLPGVMGIEGFSVAAQHISSILGSEGRAFNVTRLEDIQFMAPFKFYHNEPRRITWKAQVVREAEQLVAYASLESELTRPTGSTEHLLHFQGRVYLQPAEETVAQVTVQPPHWNGAYTVKSDDIYKLYFHGPAFQVLEGVQRSGDRILGKLNRDLPGIVAEPNSLLTTPLLVELCLQTAGIWEAGVTNTLALPSSIQELVLYPTEAENMPIYAEVEPGETAAGRITFNARVIDAKGNLYLELKDYQTMPLPYSVEQTLLEPLHGLVEVKK